MKEICVVYLRIAEHIPESIGEGCFNFEKRLKSNFIDLLEGMPINIRKILNLQFFDQISIGFRKIHLLQSSIRINMKIFGHKLSFNNFLSQISINKTIINQTLHYKLFFLSFRRIHIQNLSQLIHMISKRLLILKRSAVNIKFIDYYFLNLPEFVIEKINKDSWICYHIRIFYFWTYY